MIVTVPIFDEWDEAVIDRVSWDSANPSRWRQETGLADLCGLRCLRVHQTYELPLPIWRLPATWHQHHGHGVCVLDWNTARLALWDVALVAEDPAHAAEIERLIQPPRLPRPRVLLKVSA